MRTKAFILALLLSWSAYAVNEGKPITIPVDPLNTVDPGLYMERLTPTEDPTLQIGEFRVRSYLAPIWHIADNGSVEAITTDPQVTTDAVDGETAFEEGRNTIRFRANANGVATYRIGDYVLRTRMVQRRIEDDSTTTQRTGLDTARPASLTKPGVNRIAIASMLPGTTIEHTVQRGQIKENITIASVPDAALADTEAVVYVWQWQAPNLALTPVKVDGDIQWQNADGRTIFVMAKPDTFDANGATLRSRYIVRGGFFGVAVSAQDMRLATYPVTIDPTTSTGAATYNLSLRTGSNPYEKNYHQFALPDLSGGTATAATFNYYCNLVDGSGVSGVVSYVSEDTSWTEATAGATILALTMLGAATASTNVTSTGWKTWDVLGTTNGILQCYADSKTAATIRLDGVAGSGTNTSSTSMRFGNTADINFVYFDHKGGTNPAFIEITSTAGSSRRRWVGIGNGQGM